MEPVDGGAPCRTDRPQDVDVRPCRLRGSQPAAQVAAEEGRDLDAGPLRDELQDVAHLHRQFDRRQDDDAARLELALLLRRHTMG